MCSRLLAIRRPLLLLFKAGHLWRKNGEISYNICLQFSSSSLLSPAIFVAVICIFCHRCRYCWIVFVVIVCIFCHRCCHLLQFLLSMSAEFLSPSSAANCKFHCRSHLPFLSYSVFVVVLLSSVQLLSLSAVFVLVFVCSLINCSIFFPPPPTAVASFHHPLASFSPTDRHHLLPMPLVPLLLLTLSTFQHPNAPVLARSMNCRRRRRRRWQKWIFVIAVDLLIVAF